MADHVNQPGRRRRGTGSLLVVGIGAFFVLWVVFLVFPIGSPSSGYGWGRAQSTDKLPYNQWWALWLAIAVGALPVFVGVRTTLTGGRRTAVSAVTAFTPPVVAVALLRIASGCTAGISLGMQSGSTSCPENADALGWAVLWLGFGILSAFSILVLTRLNHMAK
jgi:hypothetical protein